MSDSLKSEFSKKKGIYFLLAGKWLPVVTALGNIRLSLAEKMGLRKGLSILWVVDFPLFEWSETDRNLHAVHHPFTSPKQGFESQLSEDVSVDDLLEIPSRAYDLVINGVEIGGGSIRITDKDLQENMFKVLGISKEVAWEKFGMLLGSFEYGVPPHGGIAFGFDRLLQVMLGLKSIRDTIAFPKSKSGRALMEGAPSEADLTTLGELELQK